MKDTEKKRVAAAKVKASPPPQPEAAAKAGYVKPKYHTTATTSMWAEPCNNWSKSGVCTRGMACLYAHKGFEVTEGRCITCGKTGHSFKECKCPGGKCDPNRDKTIAEYKKRKEANAPAFKQGGDQQNDNSNPGKGNNFRLQPTPNG